MNALPGLNVLKRRNGQLRHTHHGRLNLYLCTVFWDLDRRKGWGSNLSWMSKVTQTACGGFSTDPADVPLCAAGQRAAQASSENRPLPVCQHTAACRRGGQWSLDGKTQTERGQHRWSVWTLCVYSVGHTLQWYSEFPSLFFPSTVKKKVLVWLFDFK